jgi:hypothetical protein
MTTRDKETEIAADLMFRAAQRASAHPPFMAWLLARFQEQQAYSRSQLAAYLGLPPGQLPRLALCLRPRQDRFAEDVAAIAARVGCSPTPLADLVHRGHRRQALQRLNPPGALATHHDAASTAFCNCGFPYLRLCAFTGFCI